jgi:hypothetical protein
MFFRSCFRYLGLATRAKAELVFAATNNSPKNLTFSCDIFLSFLRAQKFSCRREQGGY